MTTSPALTYGTGATGDPVRSFAEAVQRVVDELVETPLGLRLVVENVDHVEPRALELDDEDDARDFLYRPAESTKTVPAVPQRRAGRRRARNLGRRAADGRGRLNERSWPPRNN